MLTSLKLHPLIKVCLLLDLMNITEEFCIAETLGVLIDSRVTLAPASAPFHVRGGEIFFRSVCSSVAWLELISNWLSFEQNCPTQGVSFIF
jgi:hypothetical protein